MQVLEITVVGMGDLSTLYEYELGLKGYVAAVDRTGHQEAVEEEDETFVMVAAKMDQHLGLRFCAWLTCHQPQPNIRNLLTFIKDEVTQCRKLGRFRSYREDAHRALSRTYVHRAG